MSKNYRNGAFALGLTIGASVVLLIFLYGQKAYDTAKCYQTKECERSAAKYEDQDFPSSWWWDWTGSLVTSDDTLAQWIMAVFTIAATGVLILTLWSANKTNAAAVKTSEAALDANKIMLRSQRPWIAIDIDHKGELELTDEGFTEDGDLLSEVWFVIRNVGGSSAVIDGIYRRWSVCDGKPPFPPPIEPGSRDHINGAKFKDCSIAVGAAGITGPIRTWYKNSLPLAGLTGTSRVFFDGYIEFRDLEGCKYICGFCMTFADGRFHTAWPHDDHEKYNYHRKIDEPDHG